MKNHYVTGVMIALAGTLMAGAQLPEFPTPPNAPPVPVQGTAAQPPAPPEMIRRDHLQTFGVRNESARALIVPPKGAAKPKDLVQIEEDLNVMNRILEKAAEVTDDPFRTTYITRLLGNPGPATMYLAGYGAVFLISAPFPLAPANATKDAKPAQEDPNSEWEQARRELQSGAGRNPFDPPRLILPSRFGGVQPYDQAQVERLKLSIVGALKNAVNIRALQPEEQITVVVTGSRAAASPGQRGPDEIEQDQDQNPPSQPARMIFQVKRSDLEAVEKGNLSTEALGKKVMIMVL